MELEQSLHQAVKVTFKLLRDTKKVLVEVLRGWRNLNYGIERNVEVLYKEEKVGTYRLDFIVNDALIVELKAVKTITKSHIAQTRSYLRTLEMQKGLLINFPSPEADKPEIESVSSKQKTEILV